MSKSVTIATVLRLEEDGVLHRSDPVTRYLPEFARLQVLDEGDGAQGCARRPLDAQTPMTVADLLNHTDGLYSLFTNNECLDAAIDAARLPAATSSDDLIARIAGLPLNPDGIGQYYYGLGTTVVGLVAERAAGRSLDQLVAQHITGPLGIASTLTYRLPAGATTYPRVTGRGGTLRAARNGELDIFGGRSRATATTAPFFWVAKA